MATSSLASLAGATAFAPVVKISNTTTVARSTVAFPRKSSFVVRASSPAGEKEESATAVEKPPPIGPKRGTMVRILRRESYWYNGFGKVVSVDQDPTARYPVTVRFNKVNYQGLATSSYGLDEIAEG